MQLNSKQSPKSCSCDQCTRGKGSKAGKFMMRCDERAYRRNAKELLRKFISEDDETPPLAPKGNYFD